MLLAVTLFWLPAGSSVEAQNRHNTSTGMHRHGDVDQRRGDNNHRRQMGDRDRDWNRGRWNTHGYKNYGQYRRTQVGNRRYHTERRYNR